MTQRKILIVVFTVAVVLMLMRGCSKMETDSGPGPIGIFLGGGLGMIAVALLANGKDQD